MSSGTGVTLRRAVGRRRAEWIHSRCLRSRRQRYLSTTTAPHGLPCLHQRRVHNLRGITGTSATNLYVVGDLGTVLLGTQ